MLRDTPASWGADEEGTLAILRRRRAAMAILIERRFGEGRGHAERYRAHRALQTDLGLHLSDKIAESPPQA
jgi:hypothetical protein